MEKRNIIVKIISNDNPYEFKGESRINKDILSFNDNEYSNIYDFKTNRLIREKKDYQLVIDYDSEEISLKTKEVNINFKFEVIKKKSKIIDIDISYKIKEDLIRLVIKEV